jgi:NADH dehydrogenase FAD-containing subunit
MSSPKNIVVLGASFGGLGVAHYVAKHILPKLLASNDNYTLHIVAPSTHFWWNIAAPRELVSVEEMKHGDCFVPITDGFKQYPQLGESIVFHHGSATALDPEKRSVSIALHEGGTQALSYHALVIATGVRSPTPVTTLQGDHAISQRALEHMNVQLASAKSIVISGGGPVGIETAGEIGSHYPDAKITLYAGSKKLLPVLREKLAIKAQNMLHDVGVDVVYGIKISRSEQTAGGKTRLTLSDGSTVDADVYIPAHGVTPNTGFLPEKLKGNNGYVTTNASTLRIDAAGPLVYSAGDVSGVDNGGVMNLYNSIPVLGANLAYDLFKTAGLPVGAEKNYHAKVAETQVVPIGAKQGVGAFNGWSLPSFMVSFAKGRDYMISNIPEFTEGKKWAKA